MEPPALKLEDGDKEGNEGHSKKHVCVEKMPSIDLSLTVASMSATANSWIVYNMTVTTFYNTIDF